MSKFLKLNVFAKGRGPVAIRPGKEHQFSTNKISKTTFYLKNSDREGKLEIWALGKKQGGGRVPANADGSKSHKCYGQPVTFKNKGKSTFTVSTDH